jgi:hypothetical protein
MQNLDPTYLRYIYDNLIKGSIHSENESELPDGLIGLYEEAFEEHLPIMKRQQLLKRFALFVLLKKEVSAAFVAEVLGEREDAILEFINTYSSWFNSPESVKYHLYHERLKVYLLQKLSEKEIKTIHEKLIFRLEKAIEEQKADEFELYGLEFLADHLLVSGLLKNKDSQSELVNLAFNDDFLERQLNLSNGFKWNRSTFSHALYILTLAHQSLFHENGKQITELGKRLVQLFNREQNDGPFIIELVSRGKSDLALQRLDNFSGESEYDVQRHFVLTTLCMIELIYNTPESTSKKDQIDRFLKKLVIQEDTIKNCEVVFPHVVYFDLAHRLNLMTIDYTPLTNKITKWDYKWIPRYMEFNDTSVSVLKNLLASDKEPSNKNSGLSLFSIRLCELGRFDDSLEILEMISEDIEDVELPF